MGDVSPSNGHLRLIGQYAKLLWHQLWWWLAGVSLVAWIVGPVLSLLPDRLNCWYVWAPFILILGCAVGGYRVFRNERLRVDELTKTIQEAQGSQGASSVVPLAEAAQRRRLQTMAFRGARKDQVRERTGDSPIDAHFLKEHMTRKACLSLDLDRYEPVNGDIMLTFNLHNAGESPAYDVDVSVDSDPFIPVTNMKAPLIPPDKDSTFSFSVPHPPKWRRSMELYWTFTVRAAFRDELGLDEAVFVFRFSGKDSIFTAEEDVTKAQLHHLCHYVRRS